MPDLLRRAQGDHAQSLSRDVEFSKRVFSIISQPKRMAYRPCEFRPVQRIKMKFIDTLFKQ